MEEVKKSVKGMVLIQGGGNSLRRLEPQQTIGKIMECLREVKRDKKEDTCGSGRSHATPTGKTKSMKR